MTSDPGNDTSHLRAIHWWVRLFGAVWLVALTLGLTGGGVLYMRAHRTHHYVPPTLPAWVTVTTMKSAYTQCVETQELQSRLGRMWQTDHRNCATLDR